MKLGGGEPLFNTVQYVYVFLKLSNIILKLKLKKCYQNLCACSVAQLCLTLCDPMNYSLPGSSFMEFPRQEYWSGLPCLSPGDLPDPGIKPASPAFQLGSLPLSHMGSPLPKHSSPRKKSVLNVRMIYLLLLSPYCSPGPLSSV